MYRGIRSVRLIRAPTSGFTQVEDIIVASTGILERNANQYLVESHFNLREEKKEKRKKKNKSGRRIVSKGVGKKDHRTTNLKKKKNKKKPITSIYNLKK